MKQLFAEIKRRKVIQVIVVYLVAGWLIMQVADVMFPALSLPDWAITLVAALLIVGFPVAVILSWAYQITPDGIKAEGASDPGEPEEKSTAAREPGTENQPRAKSIAVLPFVNMSPEADQEYFSDGLTEELLNVLAKIEDLKVSSRTSCFAFKGSAADIREVASKLGVAHVLEGSVRKSGNKLRVTAQLIETASDSHVWSEAYDRDLEDIFAIQDGIASQIAAVLKVKLLPQSLAAATTENVEAYQYFLRARSLFQCFGKENILNARDLFERATRIDPQFARAWAGLAQAHSYSVILFRGGKEVLEAADRTSLRAVELAPQSPEVHTARLMALAAQGRFEEAESEFRRAVELNPEEAEAYYYYARVQFKLGNLDRALELFEKASDLNPDDFQAPLVAAPIYAARNDQENLIRMCRRGLHAVEAHLAQHPDNARAYVLGAGALDWLGNRERALQFLARALDIDPGSEDTQYNAACSYARWGEIDKALACLEHGMHDPDWIENDPDLDILRDDPRYKALIKGLRNQADGS